MCYMPLVTDTFMLCAEKYFIFIRCSMRKKEEKFLTRACNLYVYDLRINYVVGRETVHIFLRQLQYLHRINISIMTDALPSNLIDLHERLCTIGHYQ